MHLSRITASRDHRPRHWCRRKARAAAVAAARLFIAGLLLLAAGGCTAALDSPLLNVQASATVPLLQPPPRLQVVYPGPAGARAGEAATVEELYGPAWQDLQPRYPGLRFN